MFQSDVCSHGLKPSGQFPDLLHETVWVKPLGRRGERSEFPFDLMLLFTAHSLSLVWSRQPLVPDVQHQSDQQERLIHLYEHTGLREEQRDLW